MVKKAIILATVILIVIFFGLKTEASKSFHKLSIYGLDIGIVSNIGSGLNNQQETNEWRSPK